MRRVAALLTGMMLLLGGTTQAWETSEDQGAKWQSIYIDVGNNLSAVSMIVNSGNEHAVLANHALSQLGLADKWGMAAKLPTVFDLNANVFRTNLLPIGTWLNGPRSSDLQRGEERTLPPPPAFAGVPDFSYATYDWINKNVYCAPIPIGAPNRDKCHVYFGGWLAAANSSHFGSQATKNYRRAHATALWLAQRAARLRSILIDNAKSAGDRKMLEDFVREAEWMALAYEGTAQHYLQDRWSTGHMWERWNAGNFSERPYRGVWSNSEVGAAAGLIHGSEALTKNPEPMSSPFYVPGVGINPAKWQRTGGGPLINGVGDDRAADMFGGFFLGYPLEVSEQRNAMMACSRAGWAEVIRGFGTNGGGFGVDKVQLQNAPATLGGDCFDMWATNRSVMNGWLADPAAQLGQFARIALGFADDAATIAIGRVKGYLENKIMGETVLEVDRTAWVRVTWRVMRHGFVNPDGINLAQGDIGDFGLAKHGGAYGEAQHPEPRSLDSLPHQDPEGRDKQSVYGFFNRAHADYWCDRLEDELKQLRGSKDPNKRAACIYLADRAFNGTPEAYAGRQSERRTKDGKRGSEPTNPVCSYFGTLGSRGNALPYDLSPGHVGFVGSRGPYDRADPDHSYQSVANWCDRVPILDFKDGAPFHAEDLVVEAFDRDKPVKLTGRDLGAAKGKLTLGRPNVAVIPINDIVSWSDSAIEFRLPKDSRVDYDDYFVFIDAADGRRAAGRFIFRLTTEPPKLKNVKLWREEEVFYQDPGDRFRPISSGPVSVELIFEGDMDQTKPAVVRLGRLDASGKWDDDRTWRGKLDVPSGTNYAAHRGPQPLAIQAYTKAGGYFRGNGDQLTPGPTPNTEHRMVIDILPPIAATVVARSGDNVIYRGQWGGGPDLDRAPNLTLKRLPVDQQRRLAIATAHDLPADGMVTLEIEFSRPLTRAPTVQVGGMAVTMKGEKLKWSGEFDVKRAAYGKIRVPVLINASDESGNNLDADPRTPPGIALDANAARWWAQYESARGGGDSRTGGQDNWHWLGRPPAQSIVIVLDTSGSMVENNSPRLKNAKAGISAMLDELKGDIEVALVWFSGCGAPRHLPFTTDIKRLRDQVNGLNASGATPYAQALHYAGKLLGDTANPASGEWRYVPFSDGLENCGGDVVGALNTLNKLVAAQGKRIEQAEPPKPPPAKPSLVERVECRPGNWQGYRVAVRSASPSDDIALIDMRFVERERPDGSCAAQYSERTFYIHYGSVRDVGTNAPARTKWGVNSRPSKDEVKRASSADGAAKIEQIRALAQAKRPSAKTIENARSEIDNEVRRNLAR